MGLPIGRFELDVFETLGVQMKVIVK